MHVIAKKFQLEDTRLQYQAYAQIRALGYLPALTVHLSAQVSEQNRRPLYKMHEMRTTCYAQELKMTKEFLAENQVPAEEDAASQRAQQTPLESAAQQDKAWLSSVKKAQQEIDDEAFADKQLKYRSERNGLDPQALAEVSTLTRQVEYEEMQAHMRALYEKVERERVAGGRFLPPKPPSLLGRLLSVLRDWLARWRQPVPPQGRDQRVATPAIDIKYYLPKPQPYRKKAAKLVDYPQSPAKGKVIKPPADQPPSPRTQ